MQNHIFDSVTRITLDKDETGKLVFSAYDEGGNELCSVRDGDEAFTCFDTELSHLLQSEHFSGLSETDDTERPTMQVFVRDIPAHLEFGECDCCRYSGDLCHECGLCADCCHSGGECGKHPHNPDRSFIPAIEATASKLIKRFEQAGYVRVNRR